MLVELSPHQILLDLRGQQDALVDGAGVSVPVALRVEPEAVAVVFDVDHHPDPARQQMVVAL